MVLSQTSKKKSYMKICNSAMITGESISTDSQSWCQQWQKLFGKTYSGGIVYPK